MDKRDFINSIKEGALKGYEAYGIIPSLTIAQAILESGWGSSQLSVRAKNLFGIKAFSNWRGGKITLPTTEWYGDKKQIINRDRMCLTLACLKTTSSTASLLSNFEIVATSIIALVVFKEAIGKRLWISITLITISSIILSVEDFGNFSFSLGSILVILACVFWGLENNCTRKLSLKDPLQVVIKKVLVLE
jgi:hypothetical protein